MGEWKECTLGELISIKGGFSYKSQYIGSGTAILLGMGCVSFNEIFLGSGARLYSGETNDAYLINPGDIVLATRQQSDNLPILGAPAITPKSEKTITDLGLSKSSAKLLPKYATVISARGTVGKYCILSEPMAFSQSNYGILPKYDNCFFFTYLAIGDSVNLLLSSAYGSVFDTITTNTFKEHSLLLPKDENVIYEFEETVTPYFKKIETNQLQIRTLTQLRDTLLPKLMSGEIKITDYV